MASAHVEYYLNQAGSGFGTYYSGPNYQRGHGFLGGLWRAVVPLLQSGAKFVGKQALRTGADIIRDMTEQRPLRESLKTRLNEAGDNLTHRLQSKVKDMTGSGILSARRQKRRHSAASTSRVQSGKGAKTKPRSVLPCPIYSVKKNGFST